MNETQRIAWRMSVELAFTTVLAVVAFGLIFTGHVLWALIPAVIAFIFLVWKMRRLGFPSKPYGRLPG